MMDQKLSLVAWYDDLIRYNELSVNNDVIEDKIKLLLESCEKQRLQCLIERNELNEAKEQFERLKKENNRLETTLKNVREAFKNEVNMKEKIKEERDFIINKLTLVQNLLLEDAKINDSEIKEKILGSLNISKLRSVSEHTDNDSLPDIEFDITDDNILINEQLHSTSHHISSIISNDLSDKEKRLRRLSREFKKDLQVELEKNSCIKRKRGSNDNHSSLSQKKFQSDEFDLSTDHLQKYDSKDSILSSIPSKLNLNKLTTVIEENSNEQEKTTLSNLEFSKNQLPSNQQLYKFEQKWNSNNLSKIDNRPHQFVTKKVFRPEKCAPCGQSIGFCSSGYYCRDCRAICHVSCKDKVILPCIPYVSRTNIGKQGKLVLISDFTSQNVRPCVPALIVHCCTEIEKRGLDDIGLYRISASKKDVDEYKERILNSKKGMPNLSTLDIYVLCGIVKDFLRGMDESLITKLAWRDFVTATAITDKEQRINYLYDLISNLHIANRDTLAYIILHLKKIAAKPSCKMPISNLAKVFGPTIVGFSMKDPPAEQMREENLKQIAVMEVLLEMDTEFWDSFISTKSCIPSISKENLNKMIDNLNQGASKFDTYGMYSNSRTSIGSRLCGGRVVSGTLTPLRSIYSKANPSKTSLIKPLF